MTQYLRDARKFGPKKYHDPELPANTSTTSSHSGKHEKEERLTRFISEPNGFIKEPCKIPLAPLGSSKRESAEVFWARQPPKGTVVSHRIELRDDRAVASATLGSSGNATTGAAALGEAAAPPPRLQESTWTFEGVVRGADVEGVTEVGWRVRDIAWSVWEVKPADEEKLPPGWPSHGP